MCCCIDQPQCPHVCMFTHTHLPPPTPPPLPAATTAPWFSVMQQQQHRLKWCAVLQGLFRAAKAPGPAGPPCQEGYSTGNTIRDTHTLKKRAHADTHAACDSDRYACTKICTHKKKKKKPDTTQLMSHRGWISCLLCFGGGGAPLQGLILPNNGGRASSAESIASHGNAQ